MFESMGLHFAKVFNGLYEAWVVKGLLYESITGYIHRAICFGYHFANSLGNGHESWDELRFLVGTSWPGAGRMLCTFTFTKCLRQIHH